jgi:prepilin-type N-terminal cleavage/methylation domain-containing protein
MTLIEIMIAIAVFGIGILAVLSLLTSNIATVDKAKIRTTMTMLTKEGMEMIYQIRDTNLLTFSQWDCLQYKDADSDVCQDSFGSLAND